MFTQTVETFLQFCDEGTFNPEQLSEDYKILNTLLQEGYDFVRAGKMKDGSIKYAQVLDYVAQREGLSATEVKTGNRADIPTFFLDNHALEAIVGDVVASRTSKTALEKMEIGYPVGRNPYYQEDRHVRRLVSHVSNEQLPSFEEITQQLGTLPQPKKHIATARALHDLRYKNESVTQAFEESMILSLA